MKSRVVLIRCASYEEKEVEEAIESGILLLGGWERFAAREERILLKPNLLAKAEPEKACTTHPALFRAVGVSLKSHGYENLCYGDSSGNHLPGLTKIAEGCGLKDPADALGIEEADFSAGREVPCPGGHGAEAFVLCDGVLQADGIINLCKMKTHQLERITGAMKNIFGCVYGFNKGVSHVKFPNADSFGAMIADLNLLVRPRLHILDGIVAMEGNGPQSGTPVEMNVILMAEDPVALDSVFCGLVNLDPALVPTNVYGMEYGVGTFLEDEIEVIAMEGGQVRTIRVSEAAAVYGKPDFDVVRGGSDLLQLRPLRPFIRFLEKRPALDRGRCIRCGLCVKSCPLPKKALQLNQKGYPSFDYKRCIRCYCCQEMCPERAILVKTPTLAKVADRNWRL